MVKLNSVKTQLCIFIYLILVSILLFFNSSIFYDKKNKLKHFGTNKNETIMPLWLAIIILALLSCYITQLLMIISK